ncbi:hypothetical protein M1384_04165 [Candidatus Parvarchaeota archaeon]|nr:hypothetical protein [Candidatus Parvarchaeota archaeon]
MDFTRDSIDGVKATLIIFLFIVIASAIGASVTSFEILLLGIGIVSFIGIISYILYIFNDNNIGFRD